MAKGLGNLVSRVSAMSGQYFNGIIPKPSDDALSAVPLKKHLFLNEDSRQNIESTTLNQFINDKIIPEYQKAFSRYQLNEALNVGFKLAKTLDGYIQEYEPFKLVKQDKEKTRAILWNLCFASGELARLLEPFMPKTSEKILNIFSFNEKSQEFRVVSHDALFPTKE